MDPGAWQALPATIGSVQGNLDPLALVAGGAGAGAGSAGHPAGALRGRPYIFNLGHGIVPQTPPHMWPGWWSWCVPDSVCSARCHRPVQPWRPGSARGDPPVPAQPVSRSRDPAGAVLRPAVPGARSRGRRLAPATANYALLGGKSPLLELTRQQAAALDGRCSRGRRRWTPNASSPCATGIRSATQAVRAVQAWQPDEVLLLPLYPQYSTTTTGSSLTAWREAAAGAGLASADDHAVLLFRRSSVMPRPSPPLVGRRL